jgi:hypothetical protein
MKAVFPVLAVTVVAFAGDAQENFGDCTGVVCDPCGGLGGWDYPQAVLFDNGPFVTGAGAGSGGSDISEMGSGESTYGFGFESSVDIMIADQFTIPTGASWNIDRITVFGYQTGSGTTSTITGAYLTIWDNPPDTGALVYGVQTTNVLTSSAWSNCYRVSNGQTTNTDRPIMANTCDLTPFTLNAGEYWLVVQLNGSASSGPWANPVTISGQPATGYAIQKLSSTWAPLTMGGTNQCIGLPFIISGSSTALNRTSWGGIKALF